MSLYEDIGGFDPILALCKAWQARLRQDPLAWHPFEHGTHPRHEERLAAYLSEAFGGPPLYTAGYGDESSVQRTHACNGDHIELDEACLTAFDLAVASVGLSGELAQRVSGAPPPWRPRSTSACQLADDVPDGLPFNYA